MINNREKWRDRARDIRAGSMTWWWWWWWYELNNIKQRLINNGMPNYIVDRDIKHFIHKTEQHNIDNTLNYIEAINLFYKRRCPWCNGYRRRKWTGRHEFKSWTGMITFLHSTNTLGKAMNPIILPPAMGKIVGQTRFFSLGEATSQGEGKLWIQTC